MQIDRNPPGDAQELELAHGAVHVWLVALDQPQPTIDRCVSLLSADEHARAQRFKFSRDRRRYVVAHGALRSIVAAYLRLAPRELTFASGPKGKPYLPAPAGTETLAFNLSHSNELALVALARTAVGVDIEYLKRDFPVEEIAKRFFTPAEVTALLSLPQELRKLAFFKCWTSKEAFLKAKGTGLSGRLDEVELTLSADRQVLVKSTVAGWFLAEVFIDHNYAAAVVTEGAAPRVTTHRWKPAVIDAP